MENKKFWYKCDKCDGSGGPGSAGCSVCEGRGKVEDPEYWYQCSDCGGSGEVDVHDGSDEADLVPARCPACDGRGSYEGDPDDHLYGGIRIPSWSDTPLLR